MKNKKKKTKVNVVRVMCWILAGLMALGCITVLVSALL
jgi:hypothetical protein